jgi:hypothetical protein
MDSDRRMLGGVCGFVLCGILIAGLWPFHGPRNSVAWLTEGIGLSLGPHGSMVSLGEFKSRESAVDSPCSIELWLRPAVVAGSGTILTFYQPSNFKASFALRQSLSDLVIQLDRQNGSHVYVQRVFLSRTPQFITITSGAQGTVAYVNGREFQRFRTYQVREEYLTGKLLVGNALAGTQEWSGQLLGLAVYDQELTPEEVLEQYNNWTTHRVAALGEGGHAVAVYPFNEGAGVVAHNQVDAATDFVIPKKFFVVNKKFLSWPWNEFYPGWSYWKDVAINIGGFVPFGFFFCAYLRLVRAASRPTLVTVILGFAVSLTIEILQAFLPTRDSGLTDVITNTVGTAAGAMLYQYAASLAPARVAGQPEKVNSVR